MNRLLPDYSVWRKKYANAALTIYIILILMEIAIYYVLKLNNMILQALPVYLRQYFFKPIAFYTAIIALAYILGIVIKKERVKNAIPIIAITCIFGVVAIIHNIFTVTMFLFTIPIMMTIVFGDKLLLWVVTVLSTIMLFLIMEYTHLKDLTNYSNPYFLPSVIISLVGLYVCSGIASTLIDLLNTQNQKLIHAVDVADQANKSKSAFLSNMSHEIRTPMNAIVGITEIMLRTKRDPADEKYLKNIKHSGNALLGIINDILDFSKIESGKMELVEDNYNIKDMLDDLSYMFWNRIGNKDIELIYDIDKNLPEILYGDELRVRQVIINLVNNAVKFTEKGFVKLSIKVESIKDQNIKLSFAVSDSGQGIKKEDLGKLFGTYEQVNTKKNHEKEGTGLGLSISKRLITMMGGDIKVDSEYKKGTTFSFVINQSLSAESCKTDYSELKSLLNGKVFALNVENEHLYKSLRDVINKLGLSIGNQDEADITFVDTKNINKNSSKKQVIVINPYNDDISDSDYKTFTKPVYPHAFNELFTDKVSSEESTIAQSATFDGAKILLVEDNLINMEVALMLFSTLNMDIDTAENGQLAADMIKEKKYDLVFMDHYMPVMDGAEATALIRSLDGDYYKNLPIIALTANAISEARDELVAIGMNDVTVKPINMEHIVEILHRYLKR